MEENRNVQSAAVIIQHAWRTYLRNRPKNDHDPLTLEPLDMITQRFYAVTPHGARYCYDAVALATYISNSSEAKDPLTGEYYNVAELRRLDRAAGTNLAHSLTDLQKSKLHKRADRSIIEYLSNDGMDVINEIHAWVSLLNEYNRADIRDGLMECHYPTLINITAGLFRGLNNQEALQDFVDALLNRLESNGERFDAAQRKVLASVKSFITGIEKVTFWLLCSNSNENSWRMVQSSSLLQRLAESLDGEILTPKTYRLLYEEWVMDEEDYMPEEEEPFAAHLQPIPTDDDLLMTTLEDSNSEDSSSEDSALGDSNSEDSNSEDSNSEDSNSEDSNSEDSNSEHSSESPESPPQNRRRRRRGSRMDQVE